MPNDGPAMLKTDGRQVRVIVVEPYCPGNWWVRIEEPCTIHGRTKQIGDTYIAANYQLTFPSTEESQ